MKKLLFLFVAAVWATMSFADCNEYGWTNGEDMYQALAADILESNTSGLCIGWEFNSYFSTRGTFGEPDVNGNTGPACDIRTFDLTFFTPEPYASKWGWLANYLDSVNVASGKTAATSGSAYMRYALTAFFANSQVTFWPYSGDYTNCGAANFLSWQPYWGKTFCEPKNCNPYGWETGDDLYKALAEDVWAYYNDASKASTFGLLNFDTENIAFHPSDLVAGTGIAYDVEPWDMNFFEDEAMKAKWGWLANYLDSVNIAYGKEAATSGNAQIRYTLTAFFANSIRDYWPRSADYTNCGAAHSEIWKPIMEQFFCNNEGGGKIDDTGDDEEEEEPFDGPCNQYGWKNKGEMFLALQEDYNNMFGRSVNAVKRENDSIFYMLSDGTYVYWKDVEASHATFESNLDFCGQTYNGSGYFSTLLATQKWSWLKAYCQTIDAKMDSTWEMTLRCNVTAFFFNSTAFRFNDIWNIPSYTEAGKPAKFYPTWGYQFCEGEDVGGDEPYTGPCNEYGWKNRSDMFRAFITDFNTFAGATLDVEACDTIPERFYNETYGIYPAAEDMFVDANYSEKWGWLLTFLTDQCRAFQGTEPNMTASMMRGAIDNFFNNGNLNSTYWNKSYDATQHGGIADIMSWQPYWGQMFCIGDTIKVTYNLPEGAVNNNPYGWTSVDDMYKALAEDVWAYHNDASKASTFGLWKFDTENIAFHPSDLVAGTGIAFDVEPWDMNFFEDEAMKAKWGWLVAYMDTACAHAGQGLATSGQAQMRYNLTAFFSDGYRNSWPKSADYATIGVSNFLAWQSYWKHAFDNRTETTVYDGWVLNAPYKEGETFRGWFLTPEGEGEPITQLTPLVHGQTLYAVFGRYQMTLAEVAAAEDDAEIYTSGVVNHVDRKDVYIQDATGGMLIYFKEAPAVEVGQRIVVSGVKATYGGAPEVKNAELKEAAAGTLPAAQVLELSNLVADPLRYFGQRVQVNDVRIAKYDDKGNPFVISGPNTVQCYKMVIDQTAFPVGQRVNLTAVAVYYNAFQFVGDIAGFEKIIYQGLKDQNTYDELVVEDEDGGRKRFSIENDWIISANMGNWDANKPNQVAEQCRGMAVKDGIIYITYRASNTPNRGELKLLRYDAATGEKLADLILAPYIFCEPAADTTGTRCVIDEETGISYLAAGYKWNYNEFTSNPIFAPNTDLRIDDAGNVLVANMPTEGHVYQIWHLTEDENGVLDGGGELVVYVGGNSGITDFATRYPDDEAIRLGRFDIAGDVNGEAWIMAACENSNIVYEMDIVGGKWDGECWNHVCQTPDLAAFSYSPRIDVVDGGEAFYVDGFADYPMLFDVDGNLLESFRGVFDEEGEEILPSAMWLLQNEDGVAPGTGVNGVHEFMVGGDYFLAMAAGNYEGAYQPYGSTLLFHFKNEYRHFYEMDRAWELPKDGMGANKNAQFNHVQQAVEVNDSTTELYIWVAENGLAKYTIINHNAKPRKPKLISEINVYNTKTIGNGNYSDDLRVTVYENAHMGVMADSTIQVKDFVQYQNIVPHLDYQWYGGNYVYTIDYRNASTVMAQTAMTAQNSTEYLKVETGRWNFISFPFDVNVSDIVAEYGVLWVIRKYSGDDRAKLTGNTWQNMSAGSMLKAGEGYILHCTDNIYRKSQVTFTIPAANTDHHNGVFATEDVTRTLNEYPSTYAHNRSWNLIGNPYSTFYVSNFMDFNAPITVWEGNGYTAYSLLDDNYLFHPNEAFFVQCPQGNPTVRFDAAGRTNDYATYEVHNYYAPRRSMDMNRRLYNFILSDGNYSDRTRLVLNDEADLAYEIERDASKFMSNDNAVPQLFSIEDGVRYAINERPEEDKMAWMGAYLATNGTYTLSLANPTNEDVLVTDLYTGITTNIARTPYIFSSNAGTYDYRFQITWPGSFSTATDLQSVIRRDEPVEVYSMQGQKMTQGLITNLLRSMPAGVYLIKQGDAVQKLTISGK